LPQLKETGRTREIVAEKVGMSPRSYEDARKVVEKIDEEEDPEVRAFLEETLNKSVNAATKFIDIPSDTIKDVIDQASGDTKNACAIINKIDNEGLRSKASLPDGKFQVLYIDLANQNGNDLAQLPLQDVGSQDSVLFIWVTPQKMKLPAAEQRGILVV